MFAAADSSVSYELRNAVEDDTDKLMEIVNTAYSVESCKSSGVCFKTGARWTDKAEPGAFVKHGRCIVASGDDGRVIGTICYALDYHGDTSQGEFGPLAVQ